MTELANFNHASGGLGIKFWRGRDGSMNMVGENARTAKLSADDVAEIKAAPIGGPGGGPGGGVSNAALGRCYQVSTTTIARIRAGKTWTAVEPGQWPPARWAEYGKERPGGEMR